MHRARVIIADDHAMVLEGLKRLLDPEFNVVAAVEKTDELLAIARQTSPDVVLLDISMPGTGGLETARQLKAALPTTKVVFVTMLTEPVYISEAFRTGALGYVLKQSAASELVSAIRTVMSNQRYLSPLLDAEVREAVETQGQGQGILSEGFTDRLTNRQREVLRLLSNGYSTKAIADALNISVKTVEFHKSNIVQKLGLHTTSELTKYALTHGLTSLRR